VPDHRFAATGAIIVIVTNSTLEESLFGTLVSNSFSYAYRGSKFFVLSPPISDGEDGDTKSTRQVTVRRSLLAQFFSLAQRMLAGSWLDDRLL
jgi:hypothetical protein